VTRAIAQISSLVIVKKDLAMMENALCLVLKKIVKQEWIAVLPHVLTRAKELW